MHWLERLVNREATDSCRCLAVADVVDAVEQRLASIHAKPVARNNREDLPAVVLDAEGRAETEIFPP
jgi:hypothetical protein